MPWVVRDRLSQTGLYAKGASGALAEGVLEFEPLYSTWTDGMSAKQWLLLPSGMNIDTSDMDDWQFPTGTKAWQQLSRDGKPVETRYVYRYGPDSDQWIMVSYAWDGDDAHAVPKGTDAIPSSKDCAFCHAGRDSHFLGVSAIQLSHNKPGLNLSSLIATHRLSNAPKGDFVLPGSPTERDVLGYFHTNCGCCHNPKGDPFIQDGVTMEHWQRVSELGSVAQTRTAHTTIDVAASVKKGRFRIVSGNPDASLVLELMKHRETGPDAAAREKSQMPPVGTLVVDQDAIRMLTDWIRSLAPHDDAGSP